MAAQVLLANADAGWIPLPDGSVHACVTSPPFYGLRVYEGLEPRVFGGDPGCRHEWDEQEYNPQPHGDDGHKSGLGGGTATQAQTRMGNVKSATCRLCGAFLGHLGLEPLHDCLGWATGNECGRCFICHLVSVFREVKRVLRSDGVAWVNLASSYSSGIIESQEYILRDDLSPEEKSFVLEELAKWEDEKFLAQDVGCYMGDREKFV